MKITIILLFAIFYNLISLSALNLSEKISLKKGEYGVFFFANLDNCVNCYMDYFVTIDDIEKNCKTKNYKFCAIINCRRDKELKLFRKKYKWKYKLIRDSKELRNSLNLNDKTELFILSPDNKVSLEFDKSGKKVIDKIVSFLNSK